MVNKRVNRVVLSTVLLGCAALGFMSSLAQTGSERSISRTHEDRQLEWTPCPAIFPKGCELVVLRGNPTNGASDVFLRTPPNYTLPQHWHTSPERMILISGELQVTYENDKPTWLKPGSYAYGPAKAKHEARCADKGPCVLFIAFDLPIDAVLVEAPK